MDFERKYGTKFWTLLDKITERTELSSELAGYELMLENLRKHEEQKVENEELLKRGVAVRSPEKELHFENLASKACSVAEMCAIDIAVKGTVGNRGYIELKCDVIMLPENVHREILAELLNSADNFYIDAVDGEVRMNFIYNLSVVEYDK